MALPFLPPFFFPSTEPHSLLGFPSEEAVSLPRLTYPNSNADGGSEFVSCKVTTGRVIASFLATFLGFGINRFQPGHN